MKKTLLFLVLFFMSATLSAQDRKVEWGIKGGINVSDLTHSDMKSNFYVPYLKVVNSKMKVSLNLGFFVEFDLYRDLLFLQPELIYSRQGNRYSLNGYKIWQRLNYFNVPVMFKIRFLKGLSIDFGPQLGLLANAKAKLEGNGESKKESFTDECERFDLGIAMGVSFYSKDRYDFSLRYIRGFTPINKDSEDTADMENRVFQLSVGVRF